MRTRIIEPLALHDTTFADDPAVWGEQMVPGHAKTADGYYLHLIVSSLDGTTPTTGTVAVKPGRKQIVVDTPSTTRSRASTHKRIELDMQPCVRYFVAGKKSSEASLRWEPEVFLTEPIGECLAEFKNNAPAAGAKQ